MYLLLIERKHPSPYLHSSQSVSVCRLHCMFLALLLYLLTFERTRAGGASFRGCKISNGSKQLTGDSIDHTSRGIITPFVFPLTVHVVMTNVDVPVSVAVGLGVKKDGCRAGKTDSKGWRRPF